MLFMKVWQQENTLSSSWIWQKKLLSEEVMNVFSADAAMLLEHFFCSHKLTWIQVLVELTLIFFSRGKIVSQICQSHAVVSDTSCVVYAENPQNNKNSDNSFFVSQAKKNRDKKNTAKPSGLDGGLCFHLFVDLLSFDDVISTSDNLSHPTANRPKMPGRRLPSRFNSSSPVSILGLFS